MTVSDCKLCHSISKSIGDEEDTLKSFMAFNITPCESVFRLIVEGQIVISHQIAMSPILFHPLTPNLFSLTFHFVYLNFFQVKDAVHIIITLKILPLIFHRTFPPFISPFIQCELWFHFVYLNYSPL